MTGQCHCGQCAVTVSRPPEFLFSCNCSLCRKSGGLWGYFAADEVTLAGVSTSYRRCDKAKTIGALNFCGGCSATTHWLADTDAGRWTYAVNMRIFDVTELEGLPVHFPDGANWSGEGPFGYVSDPIVHDGISH